MFLSISARFLVNVEALNMVESVGNVARHRRAPVVVPGKSPNEYILIYTPVISGESLANAYQRWLSRIALDNKLPVCSNCSQEFFVKHGDPEVFGNLEWELELRENIRNLDFHEIEKRIVKNCIVEDIGGFMLPEEKPVKRTSRFQVGFMVPAYDQIKSSALEAQFHVRYAPDPTRHRIYYVELGSALYTFLFNLDVGSIGYTTMIKKELVLDGENERVKRIKVAVDALVQMLENKLFGARLSRHTPVMDIRSLIVTISNPLPFVPSTGHSTAYIKETIERAEDFCELVKNEIIKGWYVDKEQLTVEQNENQLQSKNSNVEIKKVNTVSQALNEALKIMVGRSSS